MSINSDIICKNVTELNTRDVHLIQAVGLMKLLAHPVRLSILCNLMHYEELSAGEIVEAEKKRASQSQVSQYLAKLRGDNIVATRRSGQTIYYRVVDPQVQEVIKILHEIYCSQPGEEVAEIRKNQSDDGYISS